MAEGTLSQEKNENNINEIVKIKQNYHTQTFNNFDLYCLMFSFGIFLVDISTDIVLVVEYSLCGHLGWAVSSLLLMLLPASVVQLLSLKWHKLDEQISLLHYIFHGLLLGIAQRYYSVLKTAFDIRDKDDCTQSQQLFQQQNDVYILHLLLVFVQCAPQLIFQSYVLFTSDSWNLWTGLSVGASLFSLIWVIFVYTRTASRAQPEGSNWLAIILQVIWQNAMLLARMAALILFAFLFHYWFFLFIGVNWLGMTTWTLVQDSELFHGSWEERVYNVLIAFIYCFSYLNMCERCSRRKICVFYLLAAVNNITCLILIISLNLGTSLDIIIVATVLILGGTTIGLISLTLYFTKFHPIESVHCCLIFHDIERNSTPKEKQNSTPSNLIIQRSLKHLWTIDRCCTTQTEIFESSPRSEDGCTDKKLLLENWIARSGSPTFASVPISQDPIEIEQNNTFDDIEFHTILNGSQDSTFEKEKKKSPDKQSEKQKRRGICSPTELGLDLIQNDDIKCELSSQKRRGICSSDQLVLDLTDPLTDINVNDDIKLKRRPIYSVGHSLTQELNTKNLYSVKLIVNNVKPDEYIEVSSEVLSAHDYENICAVNIARERWGLRSWEGYTDIETYLHDDSTVRDRRRDTLTSTVTGTSSEISSSDIASSPPPLLPNRRRMRTRQDDYLDTLIYDLVDVDKRRVHFECTDDHDELKEKNCNLVIKNHMDVNEILKGPDLLAPNLLPPVLKEHNLELESNLTCKVNLNSKNILREPNLNKDPNIFIAKPYVIDQHGMFFPLTSALEPIQELDEPHNDTKLMHSSTSTLVTTIDEIRRGNDTDSPRHVYHRTENVWDDDVNLVKNVDVKTTQNNQKSVVKSLWNSSPNKLSNQELKKEHKAKIHINTKQDVNKIMTTNLRKPKYDDKLSLSPKKSDENRSKKENKPRRKFSLLREKFEPKTKQDDILQSYEMGSTVNLIDDLKSVKFTSSVITKVVQWNNISNQYKDEVDGQLSVADQESQADRNSLRDKRNMFLKQVLSPPKFSNRKKPVNKLRET